MVTVCNKIVEGEPVIVRRSAALGDVIAATVVARSLDESGYDVVFQSLPYCHAVLRYCPFITRYESTDQPCHVDLDGGYEFSPSKAHTCFHDLFIACAARQLKLFGVSMRQYFEPPSLFVFPEQKRDALEILERYDRPWVFINPRSLAWPHRTVHPVTWKSAAKLINGTPFWIGVDPCPDGIVDLGIRHVDNLVRFISCSDCVVTTDTGPAHIAAALSVPLVVIRQSIEPTLTVGSRSNMTCVSASLSCLNCQLQQCPINVHYPPCQNVDPSAIANAVNRQTNHVHKRNIEVPASDNSVLL